MERFKIVFKWGLLLLVVDSVASFLGAFILGLAVSSPSNSLGVSGTSIGALVGAILSLPFAYIFSYKAVLEYFKSIKGKQLPGWNIGIQVVLVAVTLSTLIDYILTKNFTYHSAVLPLILGIIAGRNAEKKFFNR